MIKEDMVSDLVVKKVLFISDDFREDIWEDMVEDFKKEESYYKNESPKVSFLIEKIESFKDCKLSNIKGYDLVAIDYGLVGNNKNMETVEKIACMTKCLWVGALGDMIKSDIKEKFPEYALAQSLEVSDIDTDMILFNFYNVLGLL